MDIKQKDIIIGALSRLTKTDQTDWMFLNPDAPNSWALRNTKVGEVWKIITPRALKFKDRLHVFLEKEAIDKLPTGSGIVKYVKDGQINIPGVGNNLPYLIFPFIDGNPLDKELIKRVKSGTKFTDDEIKTIAKQLVDAVSLMFRHGVIHQDIKPGNIILSNDLKIHILDLGIARFVYEDIKLIKRMQGPYAYLSPERLDMIANFSDTNKRRLSFASDLFSVGLILFEMTTLQRVVDIVQPGEVRTFYKSLGNYSLSDDIRNLISAMLHEDPLERQALVGGLLGVKWFSEIHESPVSWWIQHNSNGWDFIEQFLNETKPKISSGVILSADQKGKDNTFCERGKLIKSRGRKLAIDPATFRLQYDDEHHSFLKYRDYGYRVSPNRFLEPSLYRKGVEFVSQVLGFERSCNPDILIAPYFAVDTDEPSKRWLDANYGSWGMAVNYCEEKKTPLPLYFGLMLSERLVSSAKDLDDVLTQVLFDTSIPHIYLRLETERKGSDPNKNLAFIQNVRKLVSLLSVSKSILYGFSDLEVLGYFGDGLASFGINPDYEKRKQMIFDKYTKPRQEIRIDPDKRRKRYFANELLNDVLAETELRSPEAVALGSDKVFKCRCPFCFEGKHDRRLDPNANRKHFLYHIENMVAELATLKRGDERRKSFLGKLKTAKEAYQYLEGQCRMKFDKETDGSFIPIWQQAFTD